MQSQNATTTENPIDWRAEATEVSKDIYSCVTSVNLSEDLSAQHQKAAAYLNILTLENTSLTVRVNSAGFTVVGSSFDDNSLENTNPGSLVSFETPYSLLHSISPLYSASFAAQLHQKLSQLVNKSPPK